MSGAAKKVELLENRGSVHRSQAEEWGYPTGMVWCRMKMSGMAVMKCAALQKQLGCGSLRQLMIVTGTKSRNISPFWPWLRRGRRECPERAGEEEVRELRRALSPLKSAEKSRKNPRAYCCPACGGHKSFGARLCRRCWRPSAKR